MLKTALKAARASGEILRNYFKDGCEVYQKGIFDLVTDADFESEKKAIEIISQEFPDHSFACEECGAFGDTNSEYKWLIDALDGTINFSRKLPLFSVSIGLLKNDLPLLSVVYNPITDELYFAEKGKGAYLNDKKIKISNNSHIKESIFASDLTKDRNYHDQFFKIFSSLSKDILGIRLTQSTSINLAFVAEGRYDAYIKNKINFCDVAAGVLLCEEAGGLAMDFSGDVITKCSKNIIVCNQYLKNEILEKIELI